jgi:hypothetical protein
VDGRGSSLPVADFEGRAQVIAGLTDGAETLIIEIADPAEILARISEIRARFGIAEIAEAAA